MPYYHIQLKPLSPFFFGDERSFGSGANANYFVKSRHIPQQTTLLGMLRYELLRANGLLNAPAKGRGISQSNQQQATQVIGSQSFDPDNARTQQDFGQIHRLSSIWAENPGEFEDNRFYPVPINRGLPMEPYEDTGLLRSERISLLDTQPKPTLPALKYNEPKKGWRYWRQKDRTAQGFASVQGPHVSSSTIFRADERVGIQKGGGHEEDSQSYYRQRRFQFHPNWKFGFAVELDPKAADALGTQRIVRLGGERVEFHFTLQPIDRWPEEFSEIGGQPSDKLRIQLLSDAYVPDPPELLRAADFTLVDAPVTFRTLQTRVSKTAYYYKMPTRRERQKPHQAQFGPLIYLFPAGTVCYVDARNWTQFTNCLNQTAYRQIGYNQYTLISPQTES